MRRIGLLVMVLMLLAAPSGAAVPADDLTDLEAPLGGLLGAHLEGGMAYPAQGEVAADYARTYLFYMANIFYVDDAQPLADVPDGFDRYVLLPDDEVALILKWAFGTRVTPDGLVPDGQTLIERGGDYFVGVVDGYPVSVSYVQPTDDGRYLYDYRVELSDGGERSGQLTVAVQALDDPDVPLCVADIALAEAIAAEGLAGNWYAPDGYWCSLMEEGLIFCFNDQYEVIAEGAFEVSDDVLAVTLNGDAAPARVQAGALVLSIGGAERTYARGD